MDRLITIKGVGKYSAHPDTIEITFDLCRKNEEYETVINLVADAYRILTETIELCGLSAQEIKTTQYNVYPATKYVDNVWVNDGWECNQTTVLRIPLDMKNLSEIIKKVSESECKADVNVKYTLKDNIKAQEMLLKNAAVDAKFKAELLADAAGVGLGTLMSIDYNWTDIEMYSRTDCMPKMTSVTDTLFNPDDINLEERVTFVWALE